MVVGYKRVSRLEKLEFGSVSRENFTEGTDLPGAEAFGFEDLIGNLDTVVILAGIEHPHPQFVEIVIRGEVVAVGIDEREVWLMRSGRCQGRRIGFGSMTRERGAGTGSIGGLRMSCAGHEMRGIRGLSVACGGGVQRIGGPSEVCGGRM